MSRKITNIRSPWWGPGRRYLKLGTSTYSGSCMDTIRQVIVFDFDLMIPRPIIDDKVAWDRGTVIHVGNMLLTGSTEHTDRPSPFSDTVVTYVLYPGRLGMFLRECREAGYTSGQLPRTLGLNIRKARYYRGVWR